MTSNSLDLCGSWIKFIGRNWGDWQVPKLHENCLIGLFFDSTFAHPAVMFKKDSLVKQSQFYRQEFVPAEDYDLWVRLSKNFIFGNFPGILVHYRIHDFQVSQQKANELQVKKEEIFKEFVFIHLSFLSKNEIETLFEFRFNGKDNVFTKEMAHVIVKSVSHFDNLSSRNLDWFFLYSNLMGILLNFRKHNIVPLFMLSYKLPKLFVNLKLRHLLYLIKLNLSK